MKFCTIIINQHIKYLFSHQGRKKHFFKVQQGRQQKTTKLIVPSQYPKQLSDVTPLIHRGRPVRYITQKHDIPQDKFIQNTELVVSDKYNGKWQSPPNSYALNIGLIGPVNSGKSELMGKIIGRKISAVSPKSNTTTQTIEAYKSLEIQSQDQPLKNVQLKFYDTAGMMYKKTGFISKGWKVLSEIDFSLLVIDSTKRFDQMTKQSIKRLQMHKNYQNFMKALVLNKIDLVDNRRKFHSLIAQIEKYGKFDKIFYVSALTGYGIQDLQEYLIKMSKKKLWQQPKQALTNLTQIQILQQMMKQCLYHRAYKQVPYNSSVQCISCAMKSNAIQEIHFKFTIQSQNQQRMIIGEKGRNIKWILDRFKVYYAQTYNKQVEVYAQVKIRRRNNQTGILSGQTMFDQQTEKRFYKQKIAIVEDVLNSQGKFRQQNMIKWDGFYQKTDNQTREINQLLENKSPQKKQLPKKVNKKRTLKTSITSLRRRK